MTRAEYDAALRLAQSHGDGLSAELASRAFAWRHLKVIAGPRLRDAWRKVMALGPLLPLAAMAAGLLLPGVAALAFEALPVILLATLTCGLLGMPTLRLDAAVLGLALRITVCLACVAPVIGWGLAAALGADAEICALVALASAAPVGTGALGAALASGLPGGAIAGAVLVSLLAAPVLLPLVAGLVGSETGIEPWPLAISLAVLVGLPALLALALRRVPLLGTHRSRRASADIAVAALALLATSPAARSSVGRTQRSSPSSTWRSRSWAGSCTPVDRSSKGGRSGQRHRASLSERSAGTPTRRARAWRRPSPTPMPLIAERISRWN
jgi:hypothetical protein